MRGGPTLLSFMATWYCTTELDPAWDLRPTGWQVTVEGDAPLDWSSALPSRSSGWASRRPATRPTGPSTRCPFVCAAAPGIRTTVDLPQIIGALGEGHPTFDRLRQRGRPGWRYRRCAGGGDVRPLPELTPPPSGSGPRVPTAVCGSKAARTAATFVHPPVPICPVCRSRAWQPTAVVRAGHVIGYTVNQHQWHPDFEPPYVIAVVALAEDPDGPAHHQHRRLRAGEVAHRAGGRRPVRAARRRLAPAVRADRGADGHDPVAEPQRPVPRRPLGDDRFEHRVVLSGVGRSALGRRLMVDPLSLTVDACLEAVADAGLELDDIDGLSTYPGPGRHGDERGRRHRGRGGPPPPSHLDQRRAATSPARAAR